MITSFKNTGKRPIGKNTAFSAAQSRGGEGSYANVRPVFWHGRRLEEMPFPKAFALSTGLHVFTPPALAALAFLILLLLSWLLHFNWQDLFRFEKPAKDMEFVLVRDPSEKAPKNATFVGEVNQEAGGKTDPNRPVAPMENPQQASPQASQQPVPPQQASTPRPAQRPTPPQPQQPPTPKTPQPQQQQAKIKPPTPLIATPSPKVTPRPSPVPDGPVAKSSEAAAPTPASMPSPLAYATPGITGFTQRGTVGDAAVGNPEDGTSARPGVSVRSVDFGPYMSELQRRIKRNWHPPRNNRSKRVEVVFNIARDGRLVDWKVSTSSGDPLSDEAAVDALRLAAPFKPLPPEFKEEKLLIEFTFDYNVLGKG